MKAKLLIVVMLGLNGLGGTPPAEDPTSTEALTGYHRGVLGSKHDFTTAGWNNACRACHIPHVQGVRPVLPQPGEPNRQAAVERYRIQGQRRVFVPGRYTPGPTSLICLGCHDGTVATSTIGSTHALLAGAREGFPMPQGFVWRDHPIGIVYPSGDRGFRPASVVTGKGKVHLPEGRVECVSCHDPHNLSGVPKLLVMSNRRSQLCLSCHIK
ncbi:MAG: cytochrome c3 family protein [Phycisphaerae bacterium]